MAYAVITKNNDCRVRTMDESDITRVWHWRNHPDIRRWMFNQTEIPFENHCCWFKEIEKSNDKIACIFEKNEKALGFVIFDIGKQEKIGDWGFYLSPEINKNQKENKNIGTIFGCSIINYAFFELELDQILGQVIEFNKKSISFHLRMGFSKYQELNNEFFDGKDYFSVMVYKLSRTAWLNTDHYLGCKNAYE